MQNNITELTQKLLRALDSNYNVQDMPTVVDVITLLERVSITKELLEATRLGKHINELRRNTKDESLAKRVKELVKKWRNKVLSVPSADANGQIKPGEKESKKRPAKPEKVDHPPNVLHNNVKRARVNGASEYEFSDNSNSSFKDALVPQKVILINSDSNSSIPDIKNEPLLEEQQPKKRGRKKGSKNHKNLLDEAESSFTNKMAVSRGNAKVKTTQELLASLQNRNHVVTTSPGKNMEDWNERAAKLTERVSFIDQKLNASGNRAKKKRGETAAPTKNRTILESGSVTNSRIEQIQPESPATTTAEDEIVVVVDEPPDQPPPPQPVDNPYFIPSLSVEEALSRLPPIDKSCLYEPAPDMCICTVEPEPSEDPDCPARTHLEHKYRLLDIGGDRIEALHSNYLDDVNGNFGTEDKGEVKKEEDDVVNIVPNFYELSPKRVDRDSVCENYKKYSISDCDAEEGVSAERKFREYHEVLDRPSYNGDVLRILPYVIID